MFHGVSEDDYCMDRLLGDVDEGISRQSTRSRGNQVAHHQGRFNVPCNPFPSTLDLWMYTSNARLIAPRDLVNLKAYESMSKTIVLAQTA